MHLVNSSIWLLIVSMIATLDISKTIDEFGNVIEPKVEMNNSTFRYVKFVLSCHIMETLVVLISLGLQTFSNVTSE